MSKVLFLCPYVPHAATHGGSMRSRVLLQALVPQHTVHVAAAVADEQDRSNLVALARELGGYGHEVPAVSVPRARLSAKLRCWFWGRSELLHRRWQPGARAVVARLVHEGKFDWVVLDSTFVAPVWSSGGPPALFHLHNLEHAVLARRHEGPRAWRDRLTRRLEAPRVRHCERTMIGRAQLTVTVSEFDRALALGLQPKARVVAVPNSVDVDRLRRLPPAPPGPPRLLFVGALDYPPNLDAVTELVEQHLPTLRAAFPGLTVRLVGRDPMAHGDRFRGVAGVEVVGPVDDLTPHYAQCHAVYLPIRSGGGTRIKILEAWAVGRPVLATAVAAEGLDGIEGQHWRRFETPAQGAVVLQSVLAGQSESLVAVARALVEQRHADRTAIAALREHVASVFG